MSVVCQHKRIVIAALVCLIIPSALSQPVNVRRSCGTDLVERVERICQSRGGHMTYTQGRRFRRGIVSECCKYQCADHHLYAYCSNGKQDSESPDSAIIPADLDVAETRIPATYARTFGHQQSARLETEHRTPSPVEKVTVEPDHRYHDIIVNNNVDSEYVNRILKTLPHNSNDFQVGTVPPEYLNERYIPSRARIVTNY